MVLNNCQHLAHMAIFSPHSLCSLPAVFALSLFVWTVVYPRTVRGSENEFESIDKASRSENIVNQRDCRLAGGKWVPQMNIDAPWICRLPAKDQGKKCADSSQCEKYCQAPKGTQPGTHVIGSCADSGSDCSQEVKDGIAQYPACQQ